MNGRTATENVFKMSANVMNMAPNAMCGGNRSAELNVRHLIHKRGARKRVHTEPPAQRLNQSLQSPCGFRRQRKSRGDTRLEMQQGRAVKSTVAEHLEKATA
jgi:hypothetical protein